MNKGTSSRLAVAAALCVSAAGVLLPTFNGYFAAPRDCIRFGRVEFAACQPWGKTTVIENGIAIAALIAALWITTPGSTGSAVWATRLIGAAGAAGSAVGNIASAIGMEPMIAIPLATAGAGMAGGAVALASSRAVPTWRSTLGTILGLTLLIWSIAYLLRDDDRVLPQGGVLFAFPYAIWSLRLARRTWLEWRPSLGGIRYSHHWPVRVLQVGTISVFGVLLFFIVFPFWIGSTFGVAVLGDPGVEVTIENATGEPIMFYEVGRRSSFKIQMETAEKREWSWLLTGVYTPEATDLLGNPLFCRRYSDRDLRQLRYVIRIIRDPGSCPEPFPPTSLVITGSSTDTRVRRPRTPTERSAPDSRRASRL